MLERYDKWLRLACIGLGLILLGQLMRVFVRHDPLAGVSIPEVPVLASAATYTPSATSTAVKPPGASTTDTSDRAGTNAQGGSGLAGQTSGTNLLALGATNLAGTNSLPKAPGAVSGSPVAAQPPPVRPPRMGGGMPGGLGSGPPLPPLTQARIDRIVQSEMLAPIMHPLPMALLGIAGNDVFLRTATGQTGIVKEGAELGGVKVLRVAMNRVLVEENGEKKELTIFSGFGSESLLPKQNEKSK